MSRHLAGSAYETINPCIFTSGENLYEKAMGLLRDQYGGKLGVLAAHKAHLISGNEIRDNVVEFFNISNELESFESVIKFYKSNSSYFSE